MRPGQSSYTPFWLTFPAVVLMFLILILPIIIAAVLSFTDYSLGNAGANWIALENYERMVTRRAYIKMIIATVTYVGVVVPASLILGLCAALLINSLKFGQSIYKTIYFLPVMAALLAMAIVWEFALHPTIGIVNEVLEDGCSVPWLNWLLSGGLIPSTDPASSWFAIGCKKGFPLWLGDRDYAIWTICFIGIWQGFGFNMVLYLAGLTAVPRELYHAAQIDGAKSAWDRFWLVTWPMLGPTNVFVVTITSIRSFQVFDTVEALTQGGPSKSTFVMMFAIYEKAIKENQIGLGAAITIVFLVLVLLMTVIQRQFVEKKVHYS
ncbi:sugar ABC transporter permease [Alphaproteobacteria bacterium]|nr:sugar ABC transporter permease [Alphaproteobacteria bacterium]